MIAMIQDDLPRTRFQGTHDPVTEQIIRVFYDVYNELGYGFLESVYREAMRIALMQVGFIVETEVPIEVHFRGITIGIFRADLVVQHSILLELKTVEQLIKSHESQVLNYLRSTPLETALLLNFGPVPRLKRLAMPNDRKPIAKINKISDNQR